MNNLIHKRLPEFECFDRITLEVVPRYKMSGLSGDEWRQHVQVNFYFKGDLIHEARFKDMKSAAMLLGAELVHNSSSIAGRVLALEKELCDQPSCANRPTHHYFLKEEFSDLGKKLDANDLYSQQWDVLGYGLGSRKYRQFCGTHEIRGDCGREDSDRNYIKEPVARKEGT